MSKKKGNKLKASKVEGNTDTNKRVKVVQTPKATVSANKLEPAKSKFSSRFSKSEAESVLFGKKNYMLMLAGVGLIIVGLLLMTGGRNVDPNVFDDSVIYSFRRITLAPICILAGLVVEVFAIFK